ncbi:hypothetical protein DRQ53_14675 [bacterium]|nr:MAG: hypothetical protein DRQ53_14675 [bacterium]
MADEERDTMRRITHDVALALGVIGLVNVQFAIHEGTVYVIEVNPRASRTVPFLEKATNLPMVEIATRCMLGQSLADQGVVEPVLPDRVFVKGPVFPFRRFPLSDRLLGPEMKSTGEVMGIGREFGEAFSKAQVSTGVALPDSGRAFISVNDRDKDQAVDIARGLSALGFSLVATRGTREFLTQQGLECEMVAKVNEGRPDIAEMIHEGSVQLVLNTPLGKQSHFDEEAIRRAATLSDVICITTLSGGRAAVDGIRAQRDAHWSVESLQELHS